MFTQPPPQVSGVVRCRSRRRGSYPKSSPETTSAEVKLMRPIPVALVLVALLLCTAVSTPDDKKPQGAEDKPKVVKEQVRGGIVFPAERRMWTRITGKVKVVNA